MKGLSGNNYPAFAKAARELRAMGYTIISPHEDNPPGIDGRRELTKVQYLELLRHDVGTVSRKSRGLILLPGWTKSKGACLELYIALGLDMPIRIYLKGIVYDIS